MRRNVSALALVLACAGAARVNTSVAPDNQAGPERSDRPDRQDRTAGSVTPLKVQVVLSRYDGERKLASIPYVLLVNAGDHDNRVTLRMGVALPISEIGKDGPTVSFHDVGTNMDCTATPADGGRFRINLLVNHSSVFESDQKRLEAAVPRPGDSAQLIRSFTSSSVLNLKDGETGQSIAATDPVTGETMKIDVTVHVVK